MPIEPREDESKDDYMERCIEVEVEAGYPQDQAYAICISKWDSEE